MDILTAIANLGFPIVAFLLMYQLFREFTKKLDENTKVLSGLKDVINDLKEQNRALGDAIKLILQKLLNSNRRR